MKRVVAFLFSIALLAAGIFSSDAASAQNWEKYVNRELQFTINFPREPEIDNATYVTERGTVIPARIFSVEDGSALYKLTVADFARVPEEERGATAHAAETLMARGEGYHNRHAYADGLSGHDLSVVQPDGRRLQAIVYLYDHRLYIVEGSDDADAPPPNRFVYSLIITHPDGTQLNLDGYNAEEFNAFESEY